MDFLFPLLFCFIMSSTHAQKEVDILFDSNQVGNPDECQSGATNVIDRQLEQTLNELFQRGEINFDNLQQKLSEFLNDPTLQTILNGVSFNKIDDINEIETCGQGKVIEMSGTCGGAS